MKQPRNLNDLSPQANAVLLAFLAGAAFAIGGLLLYAALYPLTPLTPFAYLIRGCALIFFGLIAAVTSHRYYQSAWKAELDRAARSRTEETFDLFAFDSQDSAAATPPAERIPLTDPALQPHMTRLVEALIQSAPEHDSAIHLLVEVRKVNGKTFILYTHGSPASPGSYTTLVPQDISNAATPLIHYLLRHEGEVPGYEVVLRKSAGAAWSTDFRRLDEEPGPQWADLPRYPLRVFGKGLSLAPRPDTIFRWSHSKNPPSIIAIARKNSDEPFRQVQVTLTNPTPGIILGKGVTSAEQVIEISAGPSTKLWKIETAAFQAIWPEGFDLRCPLTPNSLLDLVNGENSLIFVQGPVSIENPLENLAAEGQTETARGETPGGHPWIEFSYDLGRVQWRQRHYARFVSPSRSFMVTAQCPLSGAEQTFLLSSWFTDSLTEPVSFMRAEAIPVGNQA
jgi:hypothetical protein